jgi:hypothetical protein
MKRALACIAWLLIWAHPAFAGDRATSPYDATVLVRLVGSVRAEIDSFGQKNVITRDHIEIASGSGFVISADGHVLTNEHVVNSSDITISDGLRKAVLHVNVAKIEVCYPPESAAARSGTVACAAAAISATDPELDLALLFVSGLTQPYLALGDSDVVTSGQPVQALGFPYGRMLNLERDALDSPIPEITTTVGTVSAVRGNASGERRVLQLDANVNSGNSGGPVINKEGFVVGVVQARLRDANSIAFAIPINQAKSFIESRGLDHMLPTRRLRPGGTERFDAKGVALRLPEGMSDASPFRSRIATNASPTDIAMRIDRVMSPWTLDRLEQELVRTQTFEPLSSANNESRTTRIDGASVLLGRASGRAQNGAEVGMVYALLDLGREKIVARFVGSAEQVAFNEGVLRDSAASIDAARLLIGELDPVEKLDWHTASAERRVAVPVGWVVEPGAPTTCPGLSNPGSAGTAAPGRDFTVSLRVAVRPGNITPEEAAAKCAPQRGSLGQTSYATRADWLGVSYAIEGFFVRGGGQVLQLEVMAPDQRSAYARALLAAWARRVE